MRSLKIIAICLLFCSLLIVVDMGHSLVPLVYYEILTIPFLFSPNAFSGGWKDIIDTMFLLNTIIAQGILLVAILRRPKSSKMLLAVGELLLMSSIFYITVSSSHDILRSYTLYSSLPCFIIFVILSYRLYAAKDRND
jgi:hypothetical protein